MEHKKTRGVYRLILKIGHSKKELCIPVFERGQYRYSVDLITIDHLLFSSWMRAQDKKELREKLLSYVLGISNQLSKKDKLLAQDKSLLNHCNEVAQELHILRHNYDFFIEGPVPGKKNTKKSYEVLYDPTMLLFYFNELYYHVEKKFNYQKEAFRKHIREENSAWHNLSSELFTALLYNHEIYQTLKDKEGDYLYRLFDCLSVYKSYQKEDYHMSTEQGKEDYKQFFLEELSRYPVLRSILNHEVILKNEEIHRLNFKIGQYYEQLSSSMEHKDLDEFYSIYDLEDLPSDVRGYADGSGERKHL